MTDDPRGAARRRYATLWTGDREPELGQAAGMLALTAYPALDVADVTRELDRIASRVHDEARMRGTTARVALHSVLFDHMRFRGNTSSYYDPRNSFLNDVLARRTGIPITLAVVYVAVGRRAGLTVDGISFPGHFIAQVRDADGIELIDPFSCGARLDTDELAMRLQQMAGPEARLGPEHLRPASLREILARMLQNLRAIYVRSGDLERLLEVVEWLLITIPDEPEVRRDRGLVLRALDCLPAARDDLIAYLEQMGGHASDREAVERIVREIEDGDVSVTVH